MRFSAAAVLGAMVVCGGVSTAPAQPEAKPEVTDEWWGPNFPEAGQQMPDVEVFDESGDAFRTSLLEGKYTVLIFGCLT